MSTSRPWLPGAVALAGAALVASTVHAGITNTKHNLSSSSGNDVRSDTSGSITTDEICVFCHTPHFGEDGQLFNRNIYVDTGFDPYASSSLDYPSAVGGPYLPGESSLMCLSCHNGQQNLGAVGVIDQEILDPSQSISMVGADAGQTMPAGAYGANSGFTRRIATDLTNDHPISFTYNSTLAAADGELRTPSPNAVMGCETCHDPHAEGSLSVSSKFLRYNRFQVAQPGGGSFDESNDIICLKCHFKDVQDTGNNHVVDWSYSVHANSSVADETYKAGPGAVREFESGAAVWEVACLNCHDTHTVAGTEHLLREGVNELDTATDPSAVKTSGNNVAIEQTCYQCHTNTAEAVITRTGGRVPNIEDQFQMAVRMPITAADAAGTTAVHDINDADFTEDTGLLGKGDLTNRHVECTDCHNPHRMIRNRAVNEDPTTPDAQGTHDHSAPHTNLAPGVLRGTTGVEPTTPFSSNAFTTKPSSFTLKKGDGGAGASSASSAAWVTREYQVCFKCHSNYAYASAPNLGAFANGTASGTNSVTQYTNQAMEFYAPSTHADEPLNLGSDGGASSSYSSNNHRSWHPVWGATGRTNTKRGTTNTAWNDPWKTYVGSQTMLCSDCHGASNSSASSVVPDGGDTGDAWGPHGSDNNFLLKGTWNWATGTGSSSSSGATTNALCFKCHSVSVYADRNGGNATGFYNSDRDNLHAYHTDKIGRLRCTWCHVAVPHGWKNKALLVNLNDVGPEVGLAAGTQVRNRTTAVYNRGPYYINAVLKIRTFRQSHSWSETSCGSAGFPGNGQSGRDWMRDSSENCANPP